MGVELARSWRLSWHGHVWGPLDLTTADVLLVGELLERDDWRIADPTQSPRTLAAMLSVLAARTADLPLDTARLAVAALPWRDLLDTLVLVADDADPEPEPEPEPEPVVPAPAARPARARRKTTA